MPDNSEDLKGSVLQRAFGNEALMDVNVNVSVVLGRSTLRVYQLLKLGRGAVIELNQKSNDPVEILANDIAIAKGEVIVVDDGRIGVTLIDLIKSRSAEKKKKK